MVDPITAVAGVGMAASAAGGIIGGIGAKQSGEAQASAYRYKAGVALINKQINEQNASWATQAGDVKAELSGLKSKSQIADTNPPLALTSTPVRTKPSGTLKNPWPSSIRTSSVGTLRRLHGDMKPKPLRIWLRPT